MADYDLCDHFEEFQYFLIHRFRESRMYPGKYGIPYEFRDGETSRMVY